MDRASIAAVRGRPGVPDALGRPAHDRHRPARGVPRRDTASNPQQSEASAEALLAGLTLLEPTTFTRDAELAAQYWVIRNGLLASVGGARPSGTSFILEDVCFPPERLAEGALALQELFARHDYDAVIFGHASAGNLHFLVTPWLAGRGRRRALRRVPVRRRGCGDRAVRRVAQGRARHGSQHRAVRRDRVGRHHHRAHARGQAADRPARRAVAGGGAHRRSGRPTCRTSRPPRPSRRSPTDASSAASARASAPSRRVTTTPRQRIALRREMVRQPAGSPVAEELAGAYCVRRGRRPAPATGPAPWPARWGSTPAT